MSPTADHTLDPRFIAGVAMIGRTKAEQFQLRYHDDETPTVWIAVAGWSGGRWEAAAAVDPVRALLRLCEQTLDGGLCRHCGLPVAFDPDDLSPPAPPLDRRACWYQFDPELATIRRGCEGDDL